VNKLKIEKAKFLIPEFNSELLLKKLERYGRVCYKSEDVFKKTGTSGMLKTIIEKNHESVLEHEKMTMLFVIDRGVSHELVRHRMASYSQESTRYCNYSKDKFGNEITVIEPIFFNGERKKIWEYTIEMIEKNYFHLLELGATPQEARSILPNSLKTEIAVTMNMRSLRNFLGLRCSKSAHPQIKEVAIPLLLYLKNKLEPLFADIDYDTDFPEKDYAEIIETNDFFEEI
jgi:thymidylate synthase (FAD)